MEKKQVVETLKKTTEKSKAVRDVMTSWALRERTRNVVTVEALAQRMKKEGFDHPQHEYAALLRQLSNLGLGKLETSASGKVKALKDVRLTLQSIGKAAVGEDTSLRGWRPRNRFGQLIASTDRAPELTQEAKQPEAPKPLTQEAPKPAPMAVGVTLVVNINGKPVNIPVPDSLTVQEVGALVAKLKGAE